MAIPFSRQESLRPVCSGKLAKISYLQQKGSSARGDSIKHGHKRTKTVLHHHGSLVFWSLLIQKP